MLAVSAAVPSAGCTRTEPALSVSPSVSGEPMEFLLGTPDGGMLSARALRGRVTVLVFATTFDLVSQEQARIASELLHRHRPRLNVALIALEPPKHAVLVQTFKKSLNLSYPVAMAEPAERRVFGALLDVDRVPVTLVLDRRGRVGFRRVGLTSLSELDDLARQVEGVP